MMILVENILMIEKMKKMIKKKNICLPKDPRVTRIRMKTIQKTMSKLRNLSWMIMFQRKVKMNKIKTPASYHNSRKTKV